MSTADALELVLTDALERATRRIIANAGPRAYTPAEVAERLQVSDDTVYRLIAAGHLQTVPHLPKKRIPQEALDRFMRGEA